MHIVMFSINPLFADRVMGGAPKQLQKVAVYLGQLGHEVTVLATAETADQAPFRWHERVLVKPILPFKQPFPQPYAIPAHATAHILDVVMAHLADADRFYMHDGEFLFPHAYQQVPTVVSLRDNVYPETLLGGFLFQGDTLIAISDYSRQLYLHTMGRRLPQLAERLVTVENGIDWEVYRPRSLDPILAHIPVDPARDAIVLHPHRPEPSKGLDQTLAVAERLVKTHGIDNLKLLVPRWLTVGNSAEVRAAHADTLNDIVARGLADHILFHDWISQELMPHYLSLGHVTLALGHFVESFGNVPYESLGCGTPAVVARVSTHRELLPDHLIDKVHYGDVETAAAITAEILREKRPVSAETLAYLHAHYGVERQLAGYAEAILQAEKRGPLRFETRPISAEACYRLAPWCYQWEDGIYHDFRAEHAPMPKLARALAAFPTGFSKMDVERLGISAEGVERWLRDGYLVPVGDATF